VEESLLGGTGIPIALLDFSSGRASGISVFLFMKTLKKEWVYSITLLFISSYSSLSVCDCCPVRERKKTKELCWAEFNSFWLRVDFKACAD